MTLRPPEPQSAPAAELYNADVLLADGRIAQIRAVRPEDCQTLEGLHDRANDDNIYSRFFSSNRVLARQFVKRVCQPDSPVRALLAFVGGSVVGLVSAEGISDGQAEVSVFVDDQLHGCGLGTLLLEHLAGWQQGNDIDTFVAEVLFTNSPMLRVFRDAGFGVSTNFESSVCTLTMSISPTKALFDAADRRERSAEQASLRHVLEPRSIAVVGVSSSRGGVGRELLENIRSSGFAGRLYAIGRHRLRIDGVTACERLSDLTEPVDLIVVAVPAADALTVVREAAAVHAKGCVVITSGFSEAGDPGRELQTQMVAAARSGGMRLIGPNCFGLISHVRDTRLNATFSTLTPSPGNLAIASQSGGVGIAALDEAAGSGIGIASFVSLGNKADVSGNDLIAAWTDDPDIEVGALYLESFGNPRKFARLARRFSEQKPLLAVFGGSSVPGRRAGESHTAARTSSSASVRALFEAAGVVGVSSIAELVDTASVFLSQPLPRGRRLAILGNAGGIGVLAADAAQAHGLEVPELAATSQEELHSLAPGAAGYTNPVDLSAAASPEAFAAAAQTLTGSPDVDALLVIVAATAVTDVKAVMSALDQALSSQRPLPAFLVILGESSHAPSRLTVLRSVERAVAALAHACSYANWRNRSQAGRASADVVRSAQARHLAGVFLSPSRAPRWLSPAESFELLGLFDIDVPAWQVVSTTTAAVEAAETIGYPVVAKACLPDVVHKTDQGLSTTQLGTAAEVDVAARRLTSLADSTCSVLIQAQAAPGTELALGVVNDSDFGPLVMVASGGVNLDVWSDQVFLMPPVTDDQVLDAVRSLRSWPLLQGHRGQPAADVAAFVRLVVQVADLALDLPELCELDLNPVIVGPNGIACVDVKVRLRAPTSSAPEAAPALSQSRVSRPSAQ